MDAQDRLKLQEWTPSAGEDIAPRANGELLPSQKAQGMVDPDQFEDSVEQES